MIASILTRFWQDQLAAHHREGVFLVLAAFLVAFACIRTSARLARSIPWWPGSVISGGVHLHHLVWGILLMLGSGTVGFAAAGERWGWELAAVGFGAGAGLTLDEFALGVHLRDVYWSHQGRKSIDAVGLATVFMALVLVGARPFDLGSVEGVSIVLVATLGLVVSCVCFLKERLLFGLVGLFGIGVLIALVPALRLAKPGSPWARWRYEVRDPRRQAAAERRFAEHRRTSRLKERVRDLVGGALPASPIETRPARRDVA